MSDVKRFEKLLEPGHIGSVRTKMRLIKIGAYLFEGVADLLFPTLPLVPPEPRDTFYQKAAC